MPTITLLLDPNGGTLAFLKEEDEATYPDVPHIEDLAAPGGTLPSGASELQDRCVDVAGVRNGMIRFWPSDPAATYSAQLYEVSNTGPFGCNDGEWDNAGVKPSRVDGFTFEDLVGDQNRAFSAFGRSWVFVHIVSLSAGTITVEIGLNAYEEGSA